MVDIVIEPYTRSDFITIGKMVVKHSFTKKQLDEGRVFYKFNPNGLQENSTVQTYLLTKSTTLIPKKNKDQQYENSRAKT